MATLTRLQPAGDQNFRSENIRWYPEGASAGFVTGDYVKVASGAVVIAAAAGNTLAASVLAGQAMADASGSSTSSNSIPVYVFDDNSIVRLPVVAGSSTTSTVSTQVATAYGIRHCATTDQGAADCWAVDINETSNVYGIVESIPLGNGLGNAYPIGTVSGTVDFRFNNQKLQLAGTKP